MAKVVVILLLAPLVLNEPDLCRNPKLDSIAFVSPDLWFFTSGGYYWFINGSDFPPGPPTGKLPDGFKKGDAAFYCDYLNACKNVPDARTDQSVVVVEKGEDGNQIIDFNTKDRTWNKSHELTSYHMMERPNIKLREEIDAIFSVGMTEVFIVQKDKYAGLDWKQSCSPKNYSVQFEAKSISHLQNSMDVPFDAITVKESTLYYFIGSKFWRSKVTKSKNGTIVILKGEQQNVSTVFFKFKECAQTDQKPNENSGAKEPQNSNPDKNDGQQSGTLPGESQDSESSQESGLGTIFLIVIVVSVVAVVLLVIGIVVFAMSAKPKPVPGKGKKAVPAPIPKPNAVPKPIKPSKK